MLFNSYTPDTVPVKVRREPAVSIHPKGTVFFGKNSCELMGLTHLDRVTLHFMGEDEDDLAWYIEKSEDGFLLRATNGGLQFNSSGLVQQLEKTLGTGSFLIATIPQHWEFEGEAEPRTTWCILNQKPKKWQKKN